MCFGKLRGGEIEMFEERQGGVYRVVVFVWGLCLVEHQRLQIVSSGKPRCGLLAMDNGRRSLVNLKDKQS